MSEGMTPTRLRLGGALFLVCGAALVGIGVYLLAGVLAWRIAADGAGLSVLWLLATGAVVGLIGAEMLVLARRPRRLLPLFVLLIAVFVVAGLWAVLASGARMPRLLR